MGEYLVFKRYLRWYANVI